MCWSQIEGHWAQARGKLEARWQARTEDDLNTIAGRRERLIGVVKKKYEAGQEEIERQVHDFEEKYTTV